MRSARWICVLNAIAMLVCGWPFAVHASNDQRKDPFAGCRGRAWRGIRPTRIDPFLFTPNAPQKPHALGYERGLWRFEARPGDGNAEGAGTDRTEMVAPYSRAGSCNTVAWRQDIWHTFSMRVSGNMTKSGKWVVAGQWHAVPDVEDAPMSPILAQSLTDGIFKISVRSDARRIQNKNGVGNPRTVYEDRTFPRDQWVRFSYHIRFDPFGKGLLQVWRDGKPIVDLHDVSIGYNDKRGPRYQFGIYRQSGSPDRIVVEFFNHKFSRVRTQ